MGFLGVCPPPYISMGRFWGGCVRCLVIVRGRCAPMAGAWPSISFGAEPPAFSGRRKDASLHHPRGWSLLMLQARAQLCGL